MMRSKVIYEKTFPPMEIPTDEEIEEMNLSDDEDTKQLSFDELMKKLYKDVVYVVIPGREAKAKTFIRNAIAVSELYELDIKIKHHFSHISATYSFDCGGGMKYLLDLIKTADDITFFKPSEGHDIVITLDFYTHAEYRNGHKMNP